jgi:hypothetical protein
LAEWQFEEAHKHNNWVDEVRVSLFLKNWHPAIEIPYTWDRQRKALVVIYESLENEYSLSSVRHSYYSPRGWERLDYIQEGFYPPIPLHDPNVDYEYWRDLSKRCELDDYGFIENWLLLWDRHFDVWEEWMM